MRSGNKTKKAAVRCGCFFFGEEVSAYSEIEEIQTYTVHGKDLALRQSLRGLRRRVYRIAVSHQRHVGRQAVCAHRLAGADHPGSVRGGQGERLPPVQHGVYRDPEEDGQAGVLGHADPNTGWIYNDGRDTAGGYRFRRAWEALSCGREKSRRLCGTGIPRHLQGRAGDRGGRTAPVVR